MLRPDVHHVSILQLKCIIHALTKYISSKCFTVEVHPLSLDQMYIMQFTVEVHPMLRPNVHHMSILQLKYILHN